MMHRTKLLPFLAAVLFCVLSASLQGADADIVVDIVAASETTQEMQLIDRETIEKSAALDTVTLLQKTLGLTVTQYGAYGNDAAVNMRGFDSGRVAILVDGVPVNSAVSGGFNFNTIDLSSIERIEVIYGGSDSKYNVSGSLGGVINIITTADRSPGLDFSLSLSNTAYLPWAYRAWSGPGLGLSKSPEFIDLLDGQHAQLNISYGAEAFSVSANAFYNRAGNHFLYKDNLVKELRRKTGNETWNSGGKLSVIYTMPDDMTRLFIDGDVYYGDVNVPTSGYSTISNKQIDVSTRQNIRLDMPIAFHDSLAMEASLSNRFALQTFTESTGVSKDSVDDIQFINRWNWFANDALTLNFGADYRYDWLRSSDMGDKNRHSGGLYIGAEYSPASTLHIVPSIKAVSDGRTVVPVPKLGLAWRPSADVTIKNNYYRSFKYPDFEDLYWNSAGYYGNPGLLPEDGFGGDLGVSYRNFDVSLFVQNTTGSIHWSNTSGTWRPENIAGSAVMFGLDAKTGLEIPFAQGFIESIDISASYQFLLSYLLCYGYTWGDNKRIPYQPMHTIGASVALNWQGGSASLSGHFEGARFSGTTNLHRLPPFLLLDIDVNQRVGKNTVFFAGVKNVLNQSYESFKDYPMPGISLTTGLRFNFGAEGGI